MSEAKPSDLELASGPAPSKKKLLIVIGAGVLVVVIGAGVAAWLLLGGSHAPKAGVEHATADHEEPAHAAKGPVIYHDFGMPFVVNLPTTRGLLQVGLRGRVFSTELADFLKHNEPALRNAVLTLLSKQDMQVLKTREGKENLRKELLKTFNELIERYKGHGEIDEVLFTSFVMQ